MNQVPVQWDDLFGNQGDSTEIRCDHSGLWFTRSFHIWVRPPTEPVNTLSTVTTMHTFRLEQHLCALENTIRLKKRQVDKHTLFLFLLQTEDTLEGTCVRTRAHTETYSVVHGLASHNCKSPAPQKENANLYRGSHQGSLKKELRPAGRHYFLHHENIQISPTILPFSAMEGKQLPPGR